MTETSEPSLQETIAQPKLVKPGSNDSSLISRLMDSIKEYLKTERLSIDEVSFYMVVIAGKEGVGICPGLFADDHTEEDKHHYIRTFPDFKEFCDILTNRRKQMDDSKLSVECLGFAPQITPRKNLMNGRYLKWPHEGFSPILINYDARSS
jgi:hypothetical protein